MSIADFITEAEDLNLYARFDPEILPTFLKPGLNAALRGVLHVAKAIQPITTYEDGKAKVLDLGTNLEAEANAESTTESDTESNTSESNPSKPAEADKEKNKVVQVPESEKERRMKDG